MRFNILALAAIVSIVALALPTQAKIVYHSADVTINDGTYNLDLNHDGITDFTISAGGKLPSCPPGGRSGAGESPASGNGALIGPLKLGDQIGASDTFESPGQFLAVVVTAKSNHQCIFNVEGPWRPSGSNSVVGYLGLSFQISGQTFYGWAHLAVKFGTTYPFTVTLLGYAYETTPGMAISAGETNYVQFIPATLQFGKVPLGNSVQGSVTLMNWLTTTLVINNATLTGVNSTNFTSGNGNPPCTGSIAAGAGCTLTFTFTPSITGNETAIYSVYDDGRVSPQKFQLRGTGQ